MASSNGICSSWLQIGKHIELDIHFIREKAIVGDIELQLISLVDQIAYGFAKA